MDTHMLRINIEVSKPIELLDLTFALASLGNEYARNAAKHGISRRDDQVKLFVSQVREGSIELDLVDLAAAGIIAAPFVMSHANLIADFLHNFKALLSWATGESKSEPETARDVQSLRNVNAVLSPIAKDPKAVIQMAPIVNNGSIEHLTVVCPTVQAAKGTVRIEERLAEIDKPKSNVHEKVLLRWHQTRNDPAAHTGDKAIIESISPKPVKTIFLAESVKARMLALNENIFRRAYIVDVAVETINSVPKVYVIRSLNEESLALDD